MSIKQLLITILLLVTTFSMASCIKNSNDTGGVQGMKFGKNLTIVILDDEIVDAAYLQKVIDGEVQKQVPYFDMWDKEELKKMIDYMGKNNYVIVPGTYTMNQAWGFEGGKFVLNNGEKREVFKFKTK